MFSDCLVFMVTILMPTLEQVSICQQDGRSIECMPTKPLTFLPGTPVSIAFEGLIPYFPAFSLKKPLSVLSDIGFRQLSSQNLVYVSYNLAVVTHVWASNLIYPFELMKERMLLPSSMILSMLSFVCWLMEKL